MGIRLAISCAAMLASGLLWLALRQRGHWFERLVRDKRRFREEKRFGKLTHRILNLDPEVWVNLLEVSRGEDQFDDLVEFRMSWPDTRFRFEIVPEFESSSARQLPGMQNLSASGRSSAGLHFAVQTNDPDRAEQLLDETVKSQINKLYRHRSTGLYVNISAGVFLVRKPELGRITNFGDFDKLVRHVTTLCELSVSALSMQFSGTAETSLEHAHCEICGDAITSDVVYCGSCRTPHHKDCWEYFGSCSIFACGETRYEAAPKTVEDGVRFLLKPKHLPTARPRSRAY